MFSVLQFCFRFFSKPSMPRNPRSDTSLQDTLCKCLCCAFAYPLLPLHVLGSQAFYLQTYSGTQLEDRCTACVVKPPDDVCNACMFDINDANVPNATLGVTNSGSISNQQTGSDSSSNSGSDSSNDSNGSSSGDIIMGLSEECEACVVSPDVFFPPETAGRGGGVYACHEKPE